MSGRRRNKTGLAIRYCAAPNCGEFALRGSVFCEQHRASALGAQAAKKLKLLVRETEKLAAITDENAKQRAAGRFRARVERGDFAALLAGRSREMMRETGKGLELCAELGALRIAMMRAMMEIDDPSEMAMTIGRMVNAATRTVREHELLREPRKKAQVSLADWVTERVVGAVEKKEQAISPPGRFPITGEGKRPTTKGG